jgi:hypothetical protein
MADNAILFKYTAKSVGMEHGVIPSFMAKPWNGVSVPYFSRKFALLKEAYYDSFLAAAGEPMCFSSCF